MNKIKKLSIELREASDVLATLDEALGRKHVIRLMKAVDRMNAAGEKLVQADYYGSNALKRAAEMTNDEQLALR